MRLSRGQARRGASGPDPGVPGVATAISTPPDGELPLRRSQKSRLGADVLTLVSGTTLSQLITVAASPLLARLFDPQAFGLYALFGSITGMIVVVVSMRYEDSIMISDKDEEAANLFGVCLVFTFGISLLTVPIVWLGKGTLVRLFKAPAAFGSILWIVSPVVLVSGIAVAFNYWNSRKKKFARLSVAKMSLPEPGRRAACWTSGYWQPDASCGRLSPQGLS